jgi:hypothetical protein
MQTAWEAFSEAYEKLGPRGSPEDREQQWFAAISKLFPGRQPDEFTAQEWGRMRDQGPSEIIPF